MKRWQRSVLATPFINSVAVFVYRLIAVVKYHWATIVDVTTWLANSNETTNHTYHLESANVRHLACCIAEVLDIEYSTVMSYFDELEHDDRLRQHIKNLTQSSDRAIMADTEARYGRRMGWYAVVRAIKPSVVVETGVDKGLGACVLTAALMKNHEEGYGGRYFGTDINPAAGYLLAGPYAQFGEILYGDSLASLEALTPPIDLFVNDSDHSAEYEGQEYEAVASKLSEQAIILGDNADVTDELLNFSLKSGRRFIFFAEKPSRHWFHGSGIGFSLPPRATARHSSRSTS